MGIMEYENIYDAIYNIPLAKTYETSILVEFEGTNENGTLIKRQDELKGARYFHNRKVIRKVFDFEKINGEDWIKDDWFEKDFKIDFNNEFKTIERNVKI